MNNLTKEEFVHVLRRQSTGFPRGSSKFRGVTLHKCGRWEARMGQFLGKKYKLSTSICNYVYCFIWISFHNWILIAALAGMCIWAFLTLKLKLPGITIYQVHLICIYTKRFH